MNIIQKLNNRIDEVSSLLCIGLDSELKKIPVYLHAEQYPQYIFNKAIIDATHTLVCAYKPNIAFYEERGEKGMKELKMTMDYLRTKYPEIITICDAKRADIGNTNKGYVAHIFDYLGFDAVTLHPYLGKEALQPFLDRKDKASIILCKTSNPGSGEFQNLVVGKQMMYEQVAMHVSKEWNRNDNCMLVVGATYPEEMKKIRSIVGTMPFLVPGIGAQGGDIQKTVSAGMDKDTRGMIINSARSIIFASAGTDFAKRAKEEATNLRTTINKFRFVK